MKQEEAQEMADAGGARREGVGGDENEDGIDPAILKDIVEKLKAGCSERNLYTGLGKVCVCLRGRVLEVTNMPPF